MGEWKSLPALLTNEAENESAEIQRLRPTEGSGLFECGVSDCATSTPTERGIKIHRRLVHGASDSRPSSEGKKSEPSVRKMTPAKVKLPPATERLLARFYEPVTLLTIGTLYAERNVFVRWSETPEGTAVDLVERVS